MLSLFIVSTVVLNVLAIEYSVSPSFTIYLLIADSFNLRTCPILSTSLVRLLSSLILSILILFFLAIEYSVSPLTTVYVSLSVLLLLLGTIRLVPTFNKLLDRLLSLFISLTVVSNFLAILHRVSPDTIFM